MRAVSRIPKTFAMRALFTTLSFGLALSLQPDASVSALQANLLQNPGFEGNYQAWSGINELQVAAGWTPWWHEDPDHNPAYFRPEYKRAVAAIFPNRVLGGDSAQQWFTFHASHLAGMYQQVFNVTPGERYRFTIWAQVWSSQGDDPNYSELPANPHLQIGIDPTGNWSPGSPAVVWSAEGSMAGLIDQWGQMSIEAAAQSSTITIFMRTNPDFANKHNDMYWDNASLVAAGPPEPTPLPPTNTPGPPSPTPAVSHTPLPTTTTAPTEMPSPTNQPTATHTAEPTEAPAATATLTTSPTPTVEQPSETPSPAPSNTPQSAATNTVTPPGQLPEVAAIAPTATQLSQTSAEPGQTVSEVDLVAALGLLALGILIGLLLAAIVILLRQKPTA